MYKILFAALDDIIRAKLCALILTIASIFYKILSLICELFNNFMIFTDLGINVEPIYRRVGLLLAVFMLFKLTFSFIQYLLNPDQINDSQKGVKKIIMRIIIAILMLGITPFLFKQAFLLQGLVFDNSGSNLIERIVLGNDNSSSVDSFGDEFSSDLLASFADEENDTEAFSSELKTDNYDNADQYITNVGNAIMALIVGAFACWMFFMYTVSLALRVIQLVFLEIIAPVPIMASIASSKDSPLEKWGKQCLTTYVDVFIRVFIMYIVIFLMSIVCSSDFLASIGDNSNFLLTLIIKVILIWAVLLFMQKASELIKEIFPGSGSKAGGDFGFGLKGRKEIPDVMRRGVGSAIGMPVNAVGRMATRTAAQMMKNRQEGKPMRKSVGKAAITGLASGFGAGLIGGWTGKGITGGIGKDIRAKNKASTGRFLNNQATGYKASERLQDYASDKLGFSSYTQKLKDRKNQLESMVKATESWKNLHQSLSDEADEGYSKGDTMEDANVARAHQKRLAAETYLKSLESDSATRRNIEEKIRLELTRAGVQPGDEFERQVNDELTDKIDKARTSLDEAKKEHQKVYIDYATNGENENSKEKMIRMVDNAINQVTVYNEYASDDYKLKYKLKDRGTGFYEDLDNYIKNKENHSTDGLGVIKDQADLEISRTEKEIAEREEKIEGNKKGS